MSGGLLLSLLWEWVEGGLVQAFSFYRCCSVCVCGGGGGGRRLLPFISAVAGRWGGGGGVVCVLAEMRSNKWNAIRSVSQREISIKI